MSSFKIACHDVNSAGHVLKCRASWPRAKTCGDIVYIENVAKKKKILLYKMSSFDLKTKFVSLKMNNIAAIELKAITIQHGVKGYY